MSLSSPSVSITTEKYFSSDEEIWETPYEPIINAFSCGWLEDGRCGYPPSTSHQLSQLSPRPIPSLLHPKDSYGRRFVCKKVSSGSRHTLFLMINYLPEKGRFGRKTKKLMFCGLNQGGLCEEDGVWSPEEIEWNVEDEPPIDITAGYGICFVTTKSGNVFSFGFGNYGVLGHGNDETWQIPRQIMSLNKHRVKQVALGRWHTLCLTYGGKVFTWGRNNRGQLGRGYSSEMETEPGLALDINSDHDHGLKISAGMLHSVAIIRVKRKDNSVSDTVFAWGEYQQCQLSSADIRNYTKPQPMRWVMKFLHRYEYTPIDISCGGYHNLLLYAPVRQLLSWGGGEYGQLGDGYAWDNPKPQVIPNVKNVISMSAGLRHSIAVCGVGGIDGIPEVYAWGDNSYGQLGLGDTNIRLQPTEVTACKRMRVMSVSTSDRHTVFVTSHKPLLARDYPMLRDFFKILEEGASRMIKNRLKLELKRNGMDPALLDNPELVMEDQAGKTDQEILNEDHEPGLKYCMDTIPSIPSLQWRRKGLECAYQCPSKGLKAICLACARRCHPKRYLTLYLRKRFTKADYDCDCRLSGNCLCCWTRVREKIDFIVENKTANGGYSDGCLGPNMVRKVLTYLRAPIPVDAADIEECLMVLANGDEETDVPRITAVAFEKWYRQHFQEFEEDDA